MEVDETNDIDEVSVTIGPNYMTDFFQQVFFSFGH